MRKGIARLWLLIGFLVIDGKKRLTFAGTDKLANLHQDALARVLNMIAQGIPFTDALGTEVIITGDPKNLQQELNAICIALGDLSEGLIRLEPIPESAQNGDG